MLFVLFTQGEFIEASPPIQVSSGKDHDDDNESLYSITLGETDGSVKMMVKAIENLDKKMDIFGEKVDSLGEKVDSLSSHTMTGKPPLSPSLQMSPFSQLFSSPKTHLPSTPMRGRSHSLPDIEADPQNFQVSQSAQTSSKPNGPPVFYPPGSYSYDIGYYNQPYFQQKSPPRQYLETQRCLSLPPVLKKMRTRRDDSLETVGLSPNFVRVLKSEANSRKNFAAILVDKAFTDAEKSGSNCSGVRGKSRLDPGRLNAVRSLVYEHFPMKQGENEDQDWRKECIKAIDEKLRRKRKEVHVHSFN